MKKALFSEAASSSPMFISYGVLKLQFLIGDTCTFSASLSTALINNALSLQILLYCRVYVVTI
jgi:hypothetical protein